MSAMTGAAALLSMNYSSSQFKDTIRIWLSFKDHITTKNVAILIIPKTFGRLLTSYQNTKRVPFKIVGTYYYITCKPIVEQQLINEQAIKKIDIDKMTDSTILKFDLSLITKEEIKK
jgi:hypothetical protein